jgi:hypothetical protein
VKKIAAILLCALLLFNWIGYRFVISYLQDKADTQLEAQLDINKYDESQLISIKIPATYLSSYSNSGTFERVSGQVDIKGIQYKYVKKRLFNDSLEYVCIADRNTMQMQSAKNEFFSLVNDLKHCGQQKKSNSHTDFSKNFSSDYFPSSSDLFIKDLSINDLKKSFSPSSTLPQTILWAIEQPPEAC